MRYELSDDEWTTIGPMLPNKARGVPPVDDRRVLNGIFWVLRSGAPWRDLPIAFGPRKLGHSSPAGASSRKRGIGKQGERRNSILAKVVARFPHPEHVAVSLPKHRSAPEA